MVEANIVLGNACTNHKKAESQLIKESTRQEFFLIVHCVAKNSLLFSPYLTKAKVSIVLANVQITATNESVQALFTGGFFILIRRG